MKKIEIYTKSWCGYCRMAKAILENEDLNFVEFDVTSDRDEELKMIERSGKRTVPQIFINDESIGGYTDLAHLSTTINLRDLVNPTDQ
jgi:NADH-dependent peroxiredoxin subunit F